MIYDGRFANNGWLQETPKPITKLTWDNAAIMSPATAHRLGVLSADMLDLPAAGAPMVELTYRGRSLRAPVFVQPGHVDGAVTLHLGYGRTRAGRSGNGMGFNPYGLRTAQALWHDTGLEARKIAGAYQFATTQNEHVLDEPAPHHPQGRYRRLSQESGIRPRGRGSSSQGPDPVPGVEIRRLLLGHGYRSERLHRMQRLRDGVRGRKQHRGGGERPGRAAAAPCIGCVWIPTITAAR